MTGFPIWYELMVADAHAVAAFYRAVLGWEIPDRGGALPNGSDYRQIRRGDGSFAGGVLTLTPGMTESGATPGWLTYFNVDDVDTAVARAEGLGAAVHMPPTTMDGAGRMAMLSDPQGAQFYVMDPMPPAGDPDASSDAFDSHRPGHGRWNELQTTDEPGATRFYKALFGWTADNAMPMGDKGQYRFVEAGGTTIGAINPWMSDYLGVEWLPYFGVAEIEAAKAAALANGGAVTHEVHEVPGGEFIFTATDPAGAHVGFVGPRPS